MPPVAKPEGTDAPTTPESNGAPEANTPPAKPTLELSEEQASYLKGLGIEDPTDPEAISKIITSGLKQKASVARISNENEQLKTRLMGQPEPDTPPKEPEAQELDTPKPASNGVTENDLFDLSMMFMQFPELAEGAQDGTILNDLRQRGFISMNGIDKKAVYGYLSQENDRAKELRELREFKAKHSTPNPADNPQYDTHAGLDLRGEMTKELARAIVVQGAETERFQEAVLFLQKNL